jgi:hypothetical protein
MAIAMCTLILNKVVLVRLSNEIRGERNARVHLSVAEHFLDDA